MKKLLIALSCSLLLITAGCYLGDPSAVKMVLLKIPAPEGQSKTNISVNETGVQEALKFIDGVLSSNGLMRVPYAQIPSSDGSIVHYQGPPTSGCGISLKDDKLYIVFIEFKRRSSSEPVKNICSLLEKELSKHYGAENVRVK